MAHTEKLCGYCAYMDLDYDHRGQFRCEKFDEWLYADSDTAVDCCKFCEIFWSKLDAARAAIETSKKYRRITGCYITTAICRILGFGDDCHELQVLKWFKTSVMENNPKYSLMLLKYEELAPVIAKQLEKEDDMDLAKNLFTAYIQGICKMIERGRNSVMNGLGDCGYYDAAIETYKEMTSCLINSRLTGFVIPEDMAKTASPDTVKQFSMRPKED